MFEKYFLGFLGSRAKTVDNRDAWQKSLIFTEKEDNEKKQTTRTYTRMYIFKKINFRENLKSSNLGPLYFNLVFFLKS